jgi:hypothetical protein
MSTPPPAQPPQPAGPPSAPYGQQPPVPQQPAAPQQPQYAQQPPHGQQQPYGQPQYPPTAPQHPAAPQAPTGAQPQHPAGAYPGQPYAGASAAVTAPKGKGNPFGLISLIAGGVLLLWQFVFLFLQAGAYAASSYETLGAIGALNGIVQGILALAALVFGFIGLAQRGKPKVVAGIGTGIGISGLVGVLVGLLFPVIIAATNF